MIRRTLIALDIRSPAAIGLLALLLIADLACIALYSWNYLNGSPRHHLKLSAESGWAEFFQHVKQMWFLILLAACWWLRRCAVIIAWAAFATMFLLDDALRLHERFAQEMTRRDVSVLGISRGAAFEAGFILTWAAVLGLCVLIAHRHSDAVTRTFSKHLAVLFAALGVVGVGVDGFHVFVDHIRYVNGIVTIIEDGGELIVVSFLVAAAFAAAETWLSRDRATADRPRSHGAAEPAPDHP